MAEYIEREAWAELVEKLKYYANTYAIGDNLGREIQGTDELLFEAAEVIEKIIAADVAPVVRCKDCKNYADCGTYYRQMYCKHQNGLNDPDDDAFCSYGERKEG